MASSHFAGEGCQPRALRCDESGIAQRSLDHRHLHPADLRQLRLCCRCPNETGPDACTGPGGAAIESQRAQALAAIFSSTFDHYSALRRGVRQFGTQPETSAALSDAGGSALQNIAVLDGTGQLAFENETATERSALHEPHNPHRSTEWPDGLRCGPRPQDVVAFPYIRTCAGERRARCCRLPAWPRSAGRQPRTAMRWHWAKTGAIYRLTMHSHCRRRRPRRVFSKCRPAVALLALARAPNWPVTVGASVQVGEALSGWYGALPLYFFFILGPAFAGAGLAVVFVREFERRTRTNTAVRALKAQDEAKRRSCSSAWPMPNAARWKPSVPKRIHHAYESRAAHAAQRHHRILRGHRAGTVRSGLATRNMQNMRTISAMPGRAACEDRRHSGIRQSGSGPANRSASPDSM